MKLVFLSILIFLGNALPIAYAAPLIDAKEASLPPASGTLTTR